MQYQPEVASLLIQLPATCTDPDAIHTTPFYLPSSLPPETLSKSSVRLVLMEKELQIGQCRDSLIQLCTKLNAQARLLKYKYVNVCHQALNTRSRNLLNRTNAKIQAITTKYRNEFAMLKVLDQSEVLYVAVSASHVTLSCDCGKFSVVYSSIDHINAT